MSQKTLIEDRQRQLEQDARVVFSSESGRRFLAALIDNCGLYHPNPDMGKRSVALGLRASVIRCDPKLWSAIEAEILARRIEPQKSKENSDE